MKKYLMSALVAATVLVAGCKDQDAKVAARNIAEAADNFEIDRRIVFYNGITGEHFLSIEGKCAFDASTANKVDVTCKTGAKEFKKHSLGLSDNVTYFSEQIVAANVSTYHYRVTFKPQLIVPDVDLRVDGQQLKEVFQ